MTLPLELATLAAQSRLAHLQRESAYARQCALVDASRRRCEQSWDVLQQQASARRPLAPPSPQVTPTP